LQIACECDTIISKLKQQRKGAKMQVTEEQKIKWAYEALCKFNIITPMDCAIEDHPKWNLIAEVAEDPEQDWN